VDASVHTMLERVHMINDILVPSIESVGSVVANNDGTNSDARSAAIQFFCFVDVLPRNRTGLGIFGMGE